jgi:hypothetical protein
MSCKKNFVLIPGLPLLRGVAAKQPGCVSFASLRAYWRIVNAFAAIFIAVPHESEFSPGDDEIKTLSVPSVSSVAKFFFIS